MINAFFSVSGSCMEVANAISSALQKAGSDAIDFIDRKMVRLNPLNFSKAAMGFGAAFLGFAVQRIADPNQILGPLDGVITTGGLIFSVMGYLSYNSEKEKMPSSKELAILNQGYPIHDTKNVVLVTWPVSDHNDAFQLKYNILKLINLNKKYRIDFITPDRQEHIIAACRKIYREGFSLKGVLIAGHGSQDSVQYSSGFSLEKYKITKDLFPGLDPNGVFIFNSCSTGAPGGIAERLSQLYPQATVYAPENISYTSHTDFYLDRRGKIAACHFDYQNQTLITRIIRNGQTSIIPDFDPNIPDVILKDRYIVEADQRIQTALLQVKTYREFLYRAAVRERTEEAYRKVINFENELENPYAAKQVEKQLERGLEDGSIKRRALHISKEP